MIAVFSSFALADDVILKLMGIGLATAILVDATIVRMVLVPGDHAAARPRELVAAAAGWSGCCRARCRRSWRRPSRSPLLDALEPGSGLEGCEGIRAGRLKESPARVRIRPRVRFPEPDGASRQQKARVIAFANQKGGVAKTTTTLNLAAAFAETGHRVLCVDMDPQGNLTMSQGIDPDTLELSMYDVLVHHIPIKQVVRTPRDRRRVRLDRPRRRGDRDVDADRPRALAGQGAEAASRTTTTSSASTRRRRSGCSRSTR